MRAEADRHGQSELQCAARRADSLPNAAADTTYLTVVDSEGNMVR